MSLVVLGFGMGFVAGGTTWALVVVLLFAARLAALSRGRRVYEAREDDLCRN